MAAGKAQNDLVDKFAKLPPAGKVGVFVAIAAVLGGMYWYLFYGDMTDQLASGKAKARTLAAEESKYKERQKQYRELLEKKKAIEDGLKTNQVALPATSELPSFFVSLQSQAIAANVQLVKWSRENEIPIENYVKVPVSITVEGDFYQILEYFKLLYETRRIITVEDLSMRDAKRQGDRVIMTASFRASTFRQADTPPQQQQPAPPASARPDDKKDAKKDATGKPDDKKAPAAAKDAGGKPAPTQEKPQ